jgi:hypothetical protein
MIRPTLAALAWATLLGASGEDARVTPVDPLTVNDDDFARHRDPAEWRGLIVTRIEFHDERAHWRLWRITHRERRKGPLFFVPHDNENAGSRRDWLRCANMAACWSRSIPGWCRGMTGSG